MEDRRFRWGGEGCGEQIHCFGDLRQLLLTVKRLPIREDLGSNQRVGISEVAADIEADDMDREAVRRSTAVLMCSLLIRHWRLTGAVRRCRRASSSAISASLERALDVCRDAAGASRPTPLDPPVQRRMTTALDRVVADPHAGDIRRLNMIEWRLRVGDRRVRFAFDDERV